MSVFIPVFIIGAVYAVAAALLQRRLIDVEKMYETRARMNSKTKDLMALAKSNTDPKLLSEKQKELTALSMESMKGQMKPMLIIFPVFLILYYVLLPAVFSSGATVTLISYKMSYRLFFIGVAFVVGIVSSLIASAYDRRRLKSKYNFGLLAPSFKSDDMQSGQSP